MALTHLTVLGHEAVVGSCDLCAESAAEITDTVSLRRNNRTFAAFSVCERCGRATRRLAALMGHDIEGVIVEAADLQLPSPEPPQIPVQESQPRLVHQFIETAIANGREYLVRAYAAERTDGTWIGWLVFTDPQSSEMRSSGPETTQSKLSDVVYWASGLESTYLEGAFGRATKVTVSAPAGGLQPEHP